MIHKMPSVIEFAVKYPGWHTYAKDRETTENVCAAVNLGIVEINQYRQFRLKSLLKAQQYLNRKGQ